MRWAHQKWSSVVSRREQIPSQAEPGRPQVQTCSSFLRPRLILEVAADRDHFPLYNVVLCGVQRLSDARYQLVRIALPRR